MEAKRRRRRKTVVEKDFDLLLQQANDEVDSIQKQIEDLKIQLKEKRYEIKKLEKEKVIYDEMKTEQEKQERIHELAELIEKSEYTVDEIKELLTSTPKDETVSE